MGLLDASAFPAGHPHYEILDKCGEGGMGVVYRARDKRLNRVVALKFIADASSPQSPDVLARFRREAEAVAALNHPNVATLFELGDWDGVPFLAMELLDGDTLKARMRPGGMPVPELLGYARQLGEGLACAHAQGILHRDVKPGNAMFNSRGTLKLLDFGLAKGLKDDDVTQTGMTVGTLWYMSPEVAAGLDASVQSDLYSFAAVVYEMASGRKIYGGQGRMAAAMGAPIPSLATLRPELPTGFSQTVAKALSRDPNHRHRSIGEFLDSLEACAAGASPEITRTMVISESAPVPVPRRPTWNPATWKIRTALVLSAILAVTAACAAGVWLLHRRGSAGPEAQRTLVVLPFENLGADPSNQALCDGLQETVSSIVSVAPSLRARMAVIPASELRRAQVRTLGDARRQFGADLAVTGSVAHAGGMLQITLNLSETEPVRQQNSRIIALQESEFSQLPERLGKDLGALFGRSALVGASTLAGETTANSAAYSLFLQGQGALVSRDFDGAIDLLSKAVAADPGYSSARARLAEAYARKYLFTKDAKWLALADAEAARAAEAGPTPLALLAEGLIRKATGRSEEAIALYRQYLEADPGNVEVSRLLADEYIVVARPADAEKVYLQALRLRPGYAPLYEALGNFHAGQQHHERQSEEAFATGIALAPKSETLQYNLGALYFQMGRWAEAEAAFRKSITLKPTGVAYSNLGAVLFYQGKYAEAARETEEATRLQPANPVNWGNLGDAWWQVEAAREKAVEAFRRAAELSQKELALNPGNRRVRKSYPLYLAKLGRGAEARTEARRAEAQWPKDGSVRFYAARAFSVVGDRKAALESLAEAAKLGYDVKEIEREPDFAPLRDSAPYQQVLKGRL